MAAFGLFGAALRRTGPTYMALEATMQPFVRLVVGYIGTPFRTQADHSYRRIFASVLLALSPQVSDSTTLSPFFLRTRGSRSVCLALQCDTAIAIGKPACCTR